MYREGTVLKLAKQNKTKQRTAPLLPTPTHYVNVNHPFITLETQSSKVPWKLYLRDYHLLKCCGNCILGTIFF